MIMVNGNVIIRFGITDAQNIITITIILSLLFFYRNVGMGSGAIAGRIGGMLAPLLVYMVS